MGHKQNILIPILIYILLAILTYFTFKYLTRNIILLSLVLPIIILIVIYIFLKLKTIKTASIITNKKAIRYTMRCLKCNWEWMSNIAAKAPNQCPNCREKEKLEIIGWRYVVVKDKKKDTTLKNYV